FSSRRRHTRSTRDWSSDVCSSDLGLVTALQEAGIEVPTHRIVHGPFDAQGGREATEKLLAQGPPYPDAIFAANDFGAIGAMGALDRKSGVEGERGESRGRRIIWGG